MTFLLAFLKDKRYTLLFALLSLLVLCISFLLYHLPLQAVVYPCIVCAAVGLGFLCMEYLQAAKRHRQMQKLLQSEQILRDMLPDAETVESNDDYALIIKLLDDLQAQKLRADEKFQDMMDYYTVWVHQIKTPIASMKLSLQNEDSAQARRLSAELFRIEQYVGMVLAFLRLDSNSTDYVFRSCDLDTLLRQSVRKYAADFIGKKLTLSYEPLGRTIVTDEKWFSFVIEQLLSNAIKYTQEGGTITIGMTDDNTLFLSDTGIGIAESDLPRIFEKGYTGFNGRTDKSASGIGLYLCKRVCTQLHIDISAESEPAKGTTMRLNLSQNPFHSD